MSATPIAAKVAYVKAQGQTRQHHCHWPGCDKQVPPAMWGCRKHWYSLPIDLRNAIWRTYRPGQEKSATPSTSYIAAARAVQTWITTNHPAARPHNNPPPAAPAPHTGATMDASVIDRPSTTTEAAAPAVPTEPGTPFQGGFYAGQFRIGADLFALIVSPKADGDAADVAWSKRGQDIPGASSCCDGLANTKAMAEAGSSLAQSVLQLDIGGFNDWYLPSRDELELVYRHLKPTAAANYASFRDGDNPSSAPVGYPYTEASPEQTKAEAFRGDGAEALEPRWYWASTQYSALSAWSQYFSDGDQNNYVKDYEGRARAVRRFKLNA